MTPEEDTKGNGTREEAAQQYADRDVLNWLKSRESFKDLVVRAFLEGARWREQHKEPAC